jgi:hypothetical protein
MAIIVLALALSPAGCSLMRQDSMSAGAKSTSGSQPAQSYGRYYDFDDIQVPKSLSLQRDESILFRVGNFKAGVLVFEDRVELESLINFFVEAMAKDNWVLKSSFKYPKTALFFAKQGKTCVIVIKEGTLTTKVEIWVAPSL